MDQGLIKSKQSGEELTPDAVAQQIQIPDQLKEAYEKLVAAGMDAMFGERARTEMMVDKMMQQEGSVGQKLGTSIAGLLGMILKESNNTIPPQVLIPAGVMLTIEAADFLRRAKIVPVDNQVIGDAMDTMITSVMKAAKLDVQKVAGFIEQKAQGGAAAQPVEGA